MYQKSDARKQFDCWSATYNYNALQSIFFRPAHKILLENLKSQDQKILDVGCGTGNFAYQVVRYFDAEVWGLDLSEGMLSQCPKHKRLHFILGDSENLSFSNNTFDVITCTHSFHHYPNQTKAINEMYRVLKPGGRTYIIDGDPDGLWGNLLYNYYIVWLEGPVKHLTSKEFEKKYRQIGFQDIQIYRYGMLLPSFMIKGVKI